jgi:hypothetical protein
MDAATAILQHDAFVVIFFHKGKPRPVRPQTGIAEDEIVIRQSEEIRDGRDIPFRDPHIARPFAAGVTALADVTHARLKHGLIITRATMGNRSLHPSLR